MSESLIISISGVRGVVGKDLTPELVCQWAAAFGQLANEAERPLVVLGRDSRTSGPMLLSAARAGLQSVGCDVIECGLIPTPTAQLAVEHHEAGGGIVLTASHNPIEWNAMKFVGPDGLFLDAETAGHLRSLAEAPDRIRRVGWDGIGERHGDPDAIRRHVEAVLALPMIDVEKIRRRRFTVALDAVRGVGGIVMPLLLEAMGCSVRGIHLEADGRFPRPPEPSPERLGDLSALVRDSRADIGFAMDPDGDRLALTDETGRAISEDYTLAFAVLSVLERTPGPVVVNLSTSLVVDDAAKSAGVSVERCKVGEANVAGVMRERKAVIGGEGNGGVMLPDLHLGRDAPVAAALVLDLLARTGKRVSELVSERPEYVIVKAKAPRGGDLNGTYEALTQHFADGETNRLDGLHLRWSDRWLHVRPSGTEPIVRMIAEGPNLAVAQHLVDEARRIFEGTT